MDLHELFQEQQSRRLALKKIGLAAGATLGLSSGLVTATGKARAAALANNPLPHIIVLC